MARSVQLSRLFEYPSSAIHRRFEICRAYYMDDLSAAAIAKRFGFHIGTVQAIVRDFAANPCLDQFFRDVGPGRKTAPKREAVLARIRELRAQHCSLGEIRLQLGREGHELSESYLAAIMRQEQLGPISRRSRPSLPGELARDGSQIPDIADVRELSLEAGRQIKTQVAGLFLFLPLLLEINFAKAVGAAGYPGTKQIPALPALLALLAPKLVGKRRVSHINDLATDEGAGLFAGLNVLPKKSYATDYSYLSQRAMNERFVDHVMQSLPLDTVPCSFNLDFHAIPFRGQKSDLENHWVAKTHQGKPAVMAFVAQEESRRVICYATANVMRSDSDDMVIRFVDHWKQLSGRYPNRVLFDSRATTYEKLDELTLRKVGFITIRRRGAAMVRSLRSRPSKEWTPCQVVQAKGKRRTARYIEQTVMLREGNHQFRQIVFEGLGHPSPTFLLTNDYPEPLTAREVIQTYAQRNHIEHSLGEKITFFHLDCLSSDVRLNVDFDLTLTVVAAMLYQRLASRLKGFEQATPQAIFRKFVNTAGSIQVNEKHIHVNFERRAHNPVLREAGFETCSAPIPWLHNKPVLLNFS